MAERILSDGFVSLVAGLGDPTRDKLAASGYDTVTPLEPVQLSDMYRSSWMARKCVDIPAKDATRKWREWQAERDDIGLIEATERRLGVQAKIRKALAASRLYGRSAIYMHIPGSGDPDTELSPERVGKEGVRHMTVLPNAYLSAGEIDQDPFSPTFGEPAYYQVSGGTATVQNVHPSRLIRFTGADLPDWQANASIFDSWGGDSVLQSVYSAFRNADAAGHNIVSLLFEAKVDVIKIAGVSSAMQTNEGQQKLQARLAAARNLKGNYGLLLLQGGDVGDADEYEQKSASFAQLPEVWNTALQVASGAADIPASRFLSQTPAGLSSTGESDLRNYYDNVNSEQGLSLQPAMAILDECLIRSALGSRPDDIHFTWAPLWQVTARERAEIGKMNAESIKSIEETGLVPPVALSKAAINLFVESGFLPGLDGYVDDEEVDFEKLLNQRLEGAGGNEGKPDDEDGDDSDESQ